MRNLLLATAALLAAAAIPASPAQAQSSGSAAFAGVSSHRHGGSSVRIHNGFVSGPGDRQGRRHGRFDDDAAIGTWYEGGEWALYNNRTWEPDSYNDWWHDRPDRAFPRWMANNGGCQRMWWSGGGWRC